MGRELSLSRQEKEKASQKVQSCLKETERERERERTGGELVTYVFSPPCFVKKKKKNRLIQCVHKPVRDAEEEGERERERERG